MNPIPSFPQDDPRSQPVQPPDEAGDLSGEDSELLQAIKESVETIRPDEQFAAQLEGELSGAIRPPGENRPGRDAGRRGWAAGAAWAALALALMAGLGWAVQNLRVDDSRPGSPLQGGGGTVPTASSTLETGLQVEPTRSPAAPETTRQPSPTPTLGFGGTSLEGEGQAYFSSYFENDVLVLQASVPTARASSGVYALASPTAPSPDSVRALAARLGMQNFGLFQTTYSEGAFIQYLASNGKQRATFYYTHNASFEYIADYQQAGAQTLNLPDPAGQMAAAETFLKEHGLLDFPYSMTPAENWPGRVFFTPLVDGLEVMADPGIVVTINAAGSVQSVIYNPPVLEKLGDFPIRSAAEAWQIVLDGQAQTGLEIRTQSEVPNTLQTWLRTYQPGSAVQMFGIPEVLHPADGGQPQVFLNNHLLTGNAAALAQTTDSAAFLQLWGTAEVQGGSTVINVRGWQTTAFQPEVLQGPVVWDGTTAFLEVDSQRYRLPDLPADAPGRQPAVVYGVRIPQPADGGSPMLDWITLSSGEAGGGGGGGGAMLARVNLQASPDPRPDDVPRPQDVPWPAGQPLGQVSYTGRRLVITSISLVYRLPAMYYIFNAPPPDPGYEVLQPLWRFAGQADDGSSFEILVQALADQFLLK